MKRSSPDTKTYAHECALDDLPAIKHASSLFLNSDMVESEQFCEELDPKKEHLYITAAYTLIQCLKALMSYEDKDLNEASIHIQHGNKLAARYRASPATLVSQVTNFVRGAPSLEAIKAMTSTQRHAELLYAETTFAKALLATVRTGSWLAFIREAGSFRTMINLYLQLGKYVEVMDAQAAARGESEDRSIDKDFRSGVELGLGASNLILSFMPKTVITVAELFGYQGNRMVGLSLLMKSGGWSPESSVPAISADDEGLRRTLSDIALLVFHVILSNFVFEGVDIPLAENILAWNLKRYPKGVFFLYAEGRLRLQRAQPSLALESHHKAIAVQDQYRNFHYVSLWEIAFCNLSLWEMSASLDAWRALQKEATWSRACYTYGTAVCLLQLGGPEHVQEATQLMNEVPGLIHKVAGKSIPVEKFVARKARQFKNQGGRLLLPALEFSYIFMSIAQAPRAVILDKMLPEVEKALKKLKAHESNPSSYEQGHGYWDDLCLARFLEGVCLRYVAYPDVYAVLDPAGDYDVSQNAHTIRAMDAFNAVLVNAARIRLDHYLIYYTHYELGRLFACVDNERKAREHLDLVVSQKPLEPSTKARKGKYSMQSTLMVRVAAELEKMNAKP